MFYNFDRFMLFLIGGFAIGTVISPFFVVPTERDILREVEALQTQVAELSSQTSQTVETK